MRPLPASMLLATVLALAVAAPAGAFWRPAVTLARGANAFQAEAAQGPDALLAVAWMRQPSASRLVRAEVARARGAGRFGRPIALDDSSHLIASPSLAFEPGGRLDVAWQRHMRTNHGIVLRSVERDGSVGRLQQLTGGGESAYEPRFSGRFGEDPWLGWSRRTPPVWFTQVSGGRTSAVLRPPGGGVFDTTLAVAPDGGLLLTWAERGVWASYKPPGAAGFSTAMRISTGGEMARSPQAAFLPDGRAAVVFSQHDGDGYALRAAVGPPDALSAPVALTGTGESAFVQSLAALPSGELDVGYVSRPVGTRSNARSGTPRLVRVGAGGRPVGAILTLDGQRSSGLRLAADASSGGYAVWIASGQVRGRRLAPGGILGTPRRLTSRGETASQLSLAAGAPSNDALVAWTTSHGAVRAARYAAAAG
jgi:hypothetical protein